MPNTAILDLIGPIQQKVPKCPELTVLAAYRRAVRSWCGQTRWLRQQLPALTVAGEPTYDLGSDPFLEIVDVPVASITVAGTGGNQSYGMRPSDPTSFDPNNPHQRPRTYAYLPEGSITFYPVPDKVYTVTLTLAVQPTANAVEIDTSMLAKHFYAFEAGALEYLLRLPEPFKDPNEATRQGAIFQASINNAKADVARGYQSGTVLARKRAWIVGP